RARLRPDFLEAREVPAGVTPDPTFSGDGVLALPGDPLNGVAVQPDGRIVAGGAVVAGGASDFFVARYNPDGSPDASFGPAGGSVVIDFGGSDTANAVALQPD